MVLEAERSGAAARVSWTACLGEQSLGFTRGANMRACLADRLCFGGVAGVQSRS